METLGALLNSLEPKKKRFDAKNESLEPKINGLKPVKRSSEG